MAQKGLAGKARQRYEALREQSILVSVEVSAAVHQVAAVLGTAGTLTPEVEQQLRRIMRAVTVGPRGVTPAV